MTESFRIRKGKTRLCHISDTVHCVNILLEMVMRQALHTFKGGFRIGGRKVSNLHCANDVVLLASSPEELQDIVNRIFTAGTDYSLIINIKKMQILTNDNSEINNTVDGEQLEQVSEFTYLGSILTSSGGCECDIQNRLQKALGVTANLKKIWNSRHIALKTKIQLLRALVWPVATHGSESWTLQKIDRQKITVFEMTT